MSEFLSHRFQKQTGQAPITSRSSEVSEMIIILLVGYNTRYHDIRYCVLCSQVLPGVVTTCLVRQG